MDGKFCPFCRGELIIENDETYKYDPILSVEVISYFCPACGYKTKQECLK